MEEKKLITPEFRVTIGNYEISEGLKVECFSSKTSKCDWGTVQLSPELEELIRINDMDPTKIELGYGDDYDELIDGYMKKNDSGILVKDDMMKLEKIRIKATFLDASPQDIIHYILIQADIYDYELTGQNYGKKAVVPIEQKNGVEAIAEVNAIWGIYQPYFFKGKRFYWGSREEQKDMYILEEGSTILSLKKYGTLWEAETLAIPWVHHSQMIEIRHSRYNGVAEVERTVTKTDQHGAVRMYISFRGGKQDV